MVRVTKGSVGLIGASVVLMVGLMPGVGQTANTVTSSDIVDETIQARDIGPNAVGQSEIQTNGVGAAEIATDAVRSPEIVHDAVGASEIATNAVGQAEIATDAVRNAEIAWNGVGASEIAPDAVGTSEIADGTVGAIDLGTDSVGSAEIVTDAVGALELADNAVASANVIDGAIGAADIGTDAVGSPEIAAGAVGTSEISDGAITGADLAPDIQVATARTYTGTSSFQLLAADLTLDPLAGTSTPGSTAFLGATMGNVIGDSLTTTNNYIGGVIGHYSVTGTNASSYPVGAVLGGIGDGTATADGAFVAYTDGTSLTTAGAAFKVMNNNSLAGSGFDFGVDLQDVAHDGFQPVDENFYNKAPLRLVRDAVVLVNTGAPTDGVTGDDVAGTGSLYVDTTNGVLYINTGPINGPTWVTVGSQP